MQDLVNAQNSLMASFNFNMNNPDLQKIMRSQEAMQPAMVGILMKLSYTLSCNQTTVFRPPLPSLHLVKSLDSMRIYRLFINSCTPQHDRSFLKAKRIKIIVSISAFDDDLCFTRH